MCKRTILLAILLVLSLTCFAQNTWSYDYEPFGYADDGYYPYDIVKGQDGGYAISGTYSTSVWEMYFYDNSFIMKFDANGQLQWAHKENEDQTPYTPQAIVALAEGGYATLVSGWSPGSAYSVSLNVYSEDGQAQEPIAFGAWDICTGLDGGIIACGGSGPNDSYSAWIGKITTSGQTVWERNYPGIPGAVRSCLDRISPTSDNCYVAFGSVEYSEDEFNALVLKVNAEGDTLWTCQIPTYAMIPSLYEDTLNGIYYFVDNYQLVAVTAAGEFLFYMIDFDPGSSTLNTTPQGNLIGRCGYGYCEYDDNLNLIWDSYTQTGFNLGECRGKRQTFVVSDDGYLVAAGILPVGTVLTLSKTNFLGTTPVQDTVITPVLPALSNYPNPFNPTTTISFSLPNTLTNPVLQVYNLKGQLVQQLGISQAQQQAGSLSFNAANQPSGVYFYRIKADNFATPVKKMTIIK